MGLVKRKKRTPEQVAATNAKRAATIAAKKEARLEALSLSPYEDDQAEAGITGNAQPKKPLAEKPVVVPPVKAEESVKPLPKALADRVEAMAGIQDDLAKEIADFKSGEAYLEGDIPITLHGLGGPGFSHGQRALNYVNPACLDPLKHYRWSHQSMVDYHRADGYTPVDHADFSRMVVARGGGHTFGKNATGHVYSGDLILIQVSKDWHDQLSKRIRDKTRSKEGRAKNNVYAKGEKLGVDVYEGSSAMSPRMEKLLSFLEKELGPGAREAFLGG